MVFDSHLHVIDPRFPLVANRGYLPPPFTVDDYRERTAALGIAGGAVVSGSFQAFDQTYLWMRSSGSGPRSSASRSSRRPSSDEEILALDRAGVRALRFNLHRGDGEFDEALAVPRARAGRLARRGLRRRARAGGDRGPRCARCRA